MFVPITLDIDYMPHLNHPLVGAYIGVDVEFNEHHINCIYEAIKYANEVSSAD